MQTEATPLKTIPRVMSLYVVAAICCLGCGGNDGTWPVAGTVRTAAGDPLASASVMFRGEDGKTYACGTDAEGRFEVFAFAKATGLPAGQYQVQVQESLGNDIDNPSPPKIHRKYAAFDSSPLAITIDPQKNQLDLSLDSP
jgi:hypothetical protein